MCVVAESKKVFFVFMLKMKPLFDIKQLSDFKPADKLAFECERCSTVFFTVRNEVKKVLDNHPRIKLKYCSKKCGYSANTTKEWVACKNCADVFEKILNQVKKYPNHFCSQSCAATYNNKNKTYGTRRSKLEVWLEEQLTILYPELDFHFNRKDAINSELDIFIPSLKLAFELNGIFHYEPIYGEDKMNQIQNNDTRKFQACLERGIELCIIDSSKLSYFKPSNAKKYLDIICSLIDKKLDW